LIPASPVMSNLVNIQASIEQLGRQIFELIDRDSRAQNLFAKKDFYGRLMEWSMRDPLFKTQMFRFVDVLPTLRSADEVIKHLSEYLNDTNTPVSTFLQGALRVGRFIPPLSAAIIRKNVIAIANLFISGVDGKSALPNLHRIWKEGARFTVDILGEAVVGEREADEYARQYRLLLDFLSERTQSWRANGAFPSNEPPFVNISVKISALCARVHSSDPETNISAILTRLKPIALRAKELGTFINLDMEHYGLKELTLEVFKRITSEPELIGYPHFGFVIQAYLHDSYRDTEKMLEWARQRSRQFTIRLVKGAYWDFEKVIAAQRTWQIPVYTSKAETDANYERITRLILENREQVYPAFASHNVRTISFAATYARMLGLEPGDYEFQMLYGMAAPIRRALITLGYRVREYCPIGELVPGMAYLVRRLLENTSNEGFLWARFGAHASVSELLRDPASQVSEEADPSIQDNHCRAADAALHPHQTPSASIPLFVNEPQADFTVGSVREKMAQALQSVRTKMGRFYPGIIAGRARTSAEQMLSLNPTRPDQVIGSLSSAGTSDVVDAVSAAKKSLVGWSKIPAENRCRILERLATKLRENRYELAAWEVFEVGKNWVEADADVAEAIDFCGFYAQEMRRLSRGRLTQETAGEVSIESYLPRGIGAVIAPWNFPLAILCGMTVAALVAGNTVVIKSAEQSSVIGAQFMNLMQEAGLPDGVANILFGSGETVGSLLVVHPEIDFVVFTGSRQVGTEIWQTAGVTHPHQKNLKKVVCEMGGKNAMIIDTDADLDEAVLGIIHSAFSYQGQKCSALSRLITIGDVHEWLTPRLIDAAAALNIGLPELPGTDMGPVIDQAALEKIQSYIDYGKREHALVYQGQVPSGLNGFFIPPTIFTGVDPASRLAQEEVFGPVLCMFRAQDMDEALRIANDSPYALTGGIYSRSPSNIALAKSEFLVGNLYINRPITGAIVGRHPFGGFKMSGSGTKAGGHDYLLHFTIPRVVTENTLRRGFAPENVPARDIEPH
jgi:RHH-type transcriptional regulator, proline utilization regulon repressor / proline dehydrogenase / delta 1-pyrroline-5-carboxylate dehydrogenase